MKDFTNILIVFLAFLFSCTQKPDYVQPELGVRSAAILDVNGFQFKDLNKNGELDKYEDWRLPIDERVADLKSQMTLEEKVGFMLISTINMGGSGGMRIPGSGGPRPKITSDFSEEESLMKVNFFTKKLNFLFRHVVVIFRNSFFRANFYLVFYFFFKQRIFFFNNILSHNNFSSFKYLIS